MIYIVINAVAIIAATLAGVMFGVVCYGIAGPARNAGIARAPASNRVVTIATAFIAELWLCAILAGALILAPPKGGVWTMTIGSAVVIWIGFVVPTQVASYRIRAVPARAMLTDCAHWLGVMLIQAVVLRLIGLVPPPV
ncbi:DUF1761 domain-containing protein [Novosphingobium sp.]|uniref:DUF1761 domain-containing protein n=1 Tax=Novosphingobium sp. TaxID=1874826 RepID=UPI0033428AD9